VFPKAQQAAALEQVIEFIPLGEPRPSFMSPMADVSYVDQAPAE